MRGLESVLQDGRDFFLSVHPPPPLQVLERKSCDLPVDGDHASLDIRLVVSVSGFKAKGRGFVLKNERT